MEKPRKGQASSQDIEINRIHWISDTVVPGQPQGTNGQICLYYPAKGMNAAFDDIIGAPWPAVGTPQPRDTSTTINRLRTKIVIQPVDQCTNGFPSNYPGVVSWKIYKDTIWANASFPQIYPNPSGSGIDDTISWIWSDDQSATGIPTKDIIDFGIEPISPHEWANRYVDRVAQPIVESNLVDTNGPITGTLNPIPPYVDMTTNGHYAGGNHPFARIDIDHKFHEPLVLPYGGVIILEARVECERRSASWWDANVKSGTEQAQLAVRIQGYAVTDYHL